MPLGSEGATVILGSELHENTHLFAKAMPKGLYFEFKGGLGDVIHQVAFSDVWARLAGMAPEDTAVVSILSPTPNAWQLFAFHPKARSIVIFQTVVEEPFTQDRRRAMQLPEVNFSRQRAGDPELPAFYSRHDEAFLDMLPVRYVAVASCASGGPRDGRSIPLPVLSEIVTLCHKLGIPAVLVGSRYHHRGPGFDPAILHNEHDRPVEAISAVDRLSVPGAIECLRRSVANVVCDSAMSHVSWSLRRPTFFVASDDQFVSLTKSGSIQPDYYRWGVSLPEVLSVPASSASKEFESFLRRFP